MFDTLISKLAVGLVSVATAVAGLFGIAAKTDLVWQPDPITVEQPVGAAIPVVVSLFETSLASKISTSDSSMTLVSGSDRNGTALNGYMCFTIDEGTASVEFVCGTASSTAVSSLTRGIDPLTGTTAVTALKKEHRRGATVKVTNYPQLAIVSRILNGDDTFPNRISYVSTIATSSLTTYNLVNKQYVDGVALQGAPTATSTTPGLVELASRTQLSAGTAMDGAYTLVPQNAFFSSTPQAATTVPVTDSNGKLAQGFQDLTVPWTFSTATSTASASADAINLVPAGAIQMFAATTSPSGWLLCDGSSVATGTYPRLFNVIAYTYGGTGANFSLPDFRARTGRGYKAASSTVDSLGETGGQETHTMTEAELAAHHHTIAGTLSSSSSGGIGAGSGTVNTGDTGSSTPFNVLDPYITVNYIIKY